MLPLSPEPESLEQFAVDVLSELDEATVARRPREVNVLLRMSMLAGLEMELTSTLNLMCDMAGEITHFNSAIAYFWEQDSEQMHARVTRNVREPEQIGISKANVLNYMAAKLARPLRLLRGVDAQADLLLADAPSLLVLPLFVRNQVLGALHLWGENAESFPREEVQLLWVLSLIAEGMLARDSTNESLLRFAFNDYLSGLRTRGYFERQLDLELARAGRRGTPVALLMIDVDYFKRLNDTLGHQAGDVVLRDVAAVLVHDLRGIDTAARYGGDEFILLLPETELAGAARVAERLRASVEQARFFIGAEPSSVEPARKISVSIGVAIFPQDAAGKRELIEASDAALYEAKARGRDQVVLYREIGSARKAG